VKWKNNEEILKGVCEKGAVWGWKLCKCGFMFLNFLLFLLSFFWMSKPFNPNSLNFLKLGSLHTKKIGLIPLVGILSGTLRLNLA